jgi:hypothetical protein
MKVGLSLFKDIIYVGKTRILKNGDEVWSGMKYDLTDEILKAVFEYMYNKAEETGYYKLSIKGFGSMTFKRDDAPNEMYEKDV